MAEQAIRLMLLDAGVACDTIQQAYVGYVSADSIVGKPAIYRVGCIGVPICQCRERSLNRIGRAHLARQMIKNEAAGCVLTVGFEQMLPGASGMVFSDRRQMLAPLIAPGTQIFGSADRDR